MEAQKIMTNKAITIYDIAKEAGVSPATVSRVLTNSANVRKDKKEKILYLIDKYDFKPNALAKGLSNTKSKVIGIVAADVRNPYYAEVFVACEIAARKEGYTVSLCNSLDILEREIEQLEVLREQRVDVIIQLGGSADDSISNKEYVDKVNRVAQTIPIVVTGKLDGTDCYQVQIDTKEAAECVLEYLIELGHTEIAMVGGTQEVLSTYEKTQHYREIFERHGIPFREDYLVEGSYDIATGYQGMNSLLDNGKVPTAVIAINDFSAVGVLHSITEHGYKIPEDISVVSYDNTYITELYLPNITSIDYNYQLFGEQLVKTAIDAVEKKDIPRLQKITPTLMVRGSSGPVKTK